MSKPRYLQVDVFSEHAGGGNPLGVVFGADAWTGEAMQRFAAWTGLVETTFVLASTREDASYRLRIFTPAREIPFAGHPTVGSAHAALAVGRVVASDGLLVQECAAGLLPIRVEGDDGTRRIYVQAPAARIVSEGANDALRGVLGPLALGALAPAFVEGGRRWWLAELAREADLRAWHPDHAAIGDLAHASDSLGLCVFARAARGAPYQLVVRAFPAGVGIVEDPASGAANGLIAAYIAQRDGAGSLAGGYRVSQGREIGHDATIDIRIEPDGAVWVGGRSWTIIDGVLERAIDA
ncbi:MAG: PhzF family phenazine biosynthesis protein [Rudaea sp.]